jgi:hypothetical protein
MTDVFRLWADSLFQRFSEASGSHCRSLEPASFWDPLGYWRSPSIAASRCEHVRAFVVEVGRGAPLLVLLQFVYFGLPTTGLMLTALRFSNGCLRVVHGAIQRDHPRRS